MKRENIPAASDAAEREVMSMTPGVELDAAVLRILGWRNDSDWHVKFGYWTHPTDNGLHVHDSHLQLSTDPNGHEALRLCGPWLDERCRWWAVTTGEMHIFGMGATKHGDSVGTKTGNAATRAEAICRLVLAVAEREGK